MQRPIDIVIRRKAYAKKASKSQKLEKRIKSDRESSKISLFLDIALVLIVLGITFMLALLFKDFVLSKKRLTEENPSASLISLSSNLESNQFSADESLEQKEVETSATFYPTPSISSPSPTKTALSYNSLKVNILNGNGIRGQANQVASMLKKIGYQDIRVGNAGSFNFLNTIIYYKPGLQEAAEKIKEDIKRPNAEIKENPNLSVDLSVILGKN